MSKYGERLRELRRLRNLTLEEVARAVGNITPQGISQIETGVTKNARLDHFLRLCEFYGVDPYRLFYTSGRPEAFRSSERTGPK